MKTIGQIIHQPQESKGLTKQPTSSVALREKMVARYGSREGLLQKANPSKQHWVANNTNEAFFGDFPTLGQLRSLGDNTPIMWLIPQLVNLSEYCGAKNKLSSEQLEDLASVISTEFYFLKISELMLFFHYFKAGRYGEFYGSIDPITITKAIRRFVKERGHVIDEHERAEKRKRLEQYAAEAVTWEEYKATHPVTNETNPFER